MISIRIAVWNEEDVALFTV